MNLSGQSVQAVSTFYKIPVTDILVISDDLDMEFKKIRYRNGGSSGGQNGLKSIVESLGTSEFARLKIGIGRDSRYEVSDWVLSKLSSDEVSSLEKEVLPLVREKIQKWSL